MPRQYVFERQEPDPKDSGAPRNGLPVARVRIDVTWDLPGDPSVVRGFNIAMVASGGTPTDVTDVKQLKTLLDASARSWTFSDVEADTYDVYVQSLRDGGDSAWRKANSEITIEDDKVPTIQTGDDRVVVGYSEDFRDSAVGDGGANGIKVYGMPGLPAYLRFTNGAINCGSTGAGTGKLEWDVAKWFAYRDMDNVVDNHRGAIAFIKVKFDTVDPSGSAPFIAAFAYNDYLQPHAAGFNKVANCEIIRDGEYHIYNVPLGRVLFSGANSIVLTFAANASAGETWSVDCLGIAFQNIDSTLDGDVDRALTARDQFGRDVDYFLRSPMHLASAGAINTQLVLDANGIYWLTDQSGQLISETPYKRGRQFTNNVTSGLFLPWREDLDEATIASYPEYDLPSKPTAFNKARFTLERVGAPNLDVAPAGSSSYPVREFLDVLPDLDGLYIASSVWYGGTQQSFGQVITGVVNKDQKSAMTRNPASYSPSPHPVINAATDSWFRGSLFKDPTGSSYPLRRSIVFRVTTPIVKKGSGSFRWADLYIELNAGEFDTVLNPPIFVGDDRIHRYKIRVLCDGNTWPFLVALPLISSLEFFSYDVCARWTGLEIEDGAATPAFAVKMDIYRLIVAKDAVNNTYPAGNHRITFVEEF